MKKIDDSDGGTTVIENAYFWLGADGELSEETEETFFTRVDDLKEQQRRWKEVDLGE